MRQAIGRWMGCVGLSAAAGCAAKEGDTGACAPEAAGGTLVATVDGAAFSTATPSVQAAGAGFQLVTAPEDGVRFTIVAQLTTGGEPALAAAEAGALPLEIPLTTGEEGGFALAYVDGAAGSLQTAAGGPGLLTLTAWSAEAAAGCLSFTAENDAGDTIAVETGSFDAPRTAR